ncbi:MAG: hypothetical protein ACE1ZV_01875 [Alphaproteobacteria bacterium]
MIALDDAAAARHPRLAAQPLFQFIVEPVLRGARLQVEKAQDQRPGKAEQRRTKRRTHAGQGRVEAGFQGIKNLAGVAAGYLQAANHVGDRAHCL